MLEAGGIARGAIGPFEVFDEAVRKRADVSWWFWQRRADADREAHLAPKNEPMRREAGRFRGRRSIRLKHRGQKGLSVVWAPLHRAVQQCDESAVKPLALAIGVRAVRRRACLVDAKSDAQLFEERALELGAAVRVDLFGRSVARYLL